MQQKNYDVVVCGGGVAGGAAALCASSDLSPRELPYEKLKMHLISIF